MYRKNIRKVFLFFSKLFREFFKWLRINIFKTLKTCPLCKRKVRDFQSNSHVIPEWMYKESGVYDKNRSISYNLKQNRRNVFQNGLKGKFFCVDCEKVTSKLDSYASQFFKKHIKPVKNFVIEQERTPDGFLYQKWSGFDFKKIQSFIYSICLREHFYRISKNEEKLIVSEKHLSNILRLYQTNDIDYLSYPIAITRYNESIATLSVVPPDVFKHEQHSIILFRAGVFQFFIKISSHPSDFFNEEFILKPPGQITMIQLEYEQTNMWKELRNQLKPLITERQNKHNPSATI